jgi:hypothetical protein
MPVDNDRLNEFVGRFVADLGAAVHAGMVVIGERLGLYKRLAAMSATTPRAIDSVSRLSRRLHSPTKTVRRIYPERSSWL